MKKKTIKFRNAKKLDKQWALRVVNKVLFFFVLRGNRPLSNAVSLLDNSSDVNYIKL